MIGSKLNASEICGFLFYKWSITPELPEHFLNNLRCEEGKICCGSTLFLVQSIFLSKDRINPQHIYPPIKIGFELIRHISSCRSNMSFPPNLQRALPLKLVLLFQINSLPQSICCICLVNVEDALSEIKSETTS